MIDKGSARTEEAPIVTRAGLAALKLFNLGQGKSLSQIAGEFGLSKTDVVCLIVPLLRSGLVGRRKLTDDWRDDVFYQLRDARGVSSKEELLNRLKGEIVRFRNEIRRLQDDVVKKQELMRYSNQIALIRNFNLGEGKTISMIEKETGMNPARIHQVMDNLAESGVVGKKYISQGQFFYYPARRLRQVSSIPTEEEIRRIKVEMRRLSSEVMAREDSIRRLIKRAVLRSLKLGRIGKSASEIAKRTRMSTADVIGMMMTYVRSGLVEQSFTSQGFFYSVIRRKREPTPVPGVEVIVPTSVKEVLEVKTKIASGEMTSSREVSGTPVTAVVSGPQLEVKQAVQPEASAALGIIDELLSRLSVRELVLLRERINIELRKKEQA